MRSSQIACALAVGVLCFFAEHISSAQVEISDSASSDSDPMAGFTPEQRRLILQQRFNPRRPELPVDPDNWVRDDPSTRDNAQTRQWRTDLKECGPEADHFRTALLEFEKLAPRDKVRGGAEWNALAAQAAQYSRLCLEAIGETSPPREVGAYLSSVGVLVDTQEAFCGAIALTDTMILTARHCFYSIDGDIPNAFHESLRAGHVQFASLRDSSPLIEVAGIRVSDSPVTGTGRITHLNDYVFLDLRASLPGFTAIPLSRDFASNAVRRVWLPGPFRFAYAPDASDLAAAARTSARWSRSGWCPATISRSGCVQHGCQSVGGFSGSPLLELQSDGTVSLLGLHRQANDGTGLCAVSGQRSGNFALAANRIAGIGVTP